MLEDKQQINTGNKASKITRVGNGSRRTDRMHRNEKREKTLMDGVW